MVAAVLSGNRNFEGRINPLVRANYLASPPLVVAYALAGRVDIDLHNDPLGTDTDGAAGLSAETSGRRTEEVQDTDAPRPSSRRCSSTSTQKRSRATRTGRSCRSRRARRTSGTTTPLTSRGRPISTRWWIPTAPIRTSRHARAGAAGRFRHHGPHLAGRLDSGRQSRPGKYLIAQGVEPDDFNSYGARRGNHEVMVRGTLANIRLRNQLAPGTEGGWTVHLPDGEQMCIYDASVRYQQEGVPLMIIAGKEYGSGSSRDWAAKGVLLLGVKAVIAESFERIHRTQSGGHGRAAAAVPCRAKTRRA